MGGEIKIVDKDIQGERGSCFRFSVALTLRHPPTTGIHRCFGMHLEANRPRSDASHVILFLAGEERRRVTKRLMQRFGL